MKNALFILLIVLASCKNDKVESKIIIEGHINNFPDRKLYLSDISKRDVPLDSTLMHNGDFQFELKHDSAFYPFEACITYLDTFKPKKITYLRPIGFTNPYREKTVMSSFYIDGGITIIEGDNGPNSFLTIRGSKQTEPFYRMVMGSFGNIKGYESAKRQEKLDTYRKTIQQYPYSFFLLKRLKQFQADYKEDELKYLLSSFNKDVSASPMFKDFESFFSHRRNFRGYFTNLSMSIAGSQTQTIFDSTAKVNMLVFWASWCGPCRKEIPQLKQLYKKYAGKGLSISSISIDNNLKNWNTALAIEQMPWKQFIVSDSTKKIIDLEYDIRFIPIAVFTDAKGKLIKRVTDTAEYDSLLSKLF